MQQRQTLLQIYQAALARVEGRSAVSAWLKKNPIEQQVRLIAIGKAAQSMAMGAHDCLGERIRQGLIISKGGHIDFNVCHDFGWEAIEAAHPVPDAASLQAGQRLLGFLSDVDQLPLLVLISGGASSLVELPIEGVDLPFLARANKWLLGSGLDIVPMNWVRKGLSQIKGGGLLSWLGEREVHLLAISDVPGDLPSAIGSGLLVPETALQEQISTLTLPDWLNEKLEPGLRLRSTRVVSGNPPKCHIIANLASAKLAAAEKAKALGYTVTLEQEFLQGEAAEVGHALAGRLIEAAPGIIVWGGETTVNLPADPGRGGRNQHLALAAASVLAGSQNCYLLSAGTDGSDGPTEDAGAIVDGYTISRGEQEGFEAVHCLTMANSGELLEASGDLITTGPTGTNVMDLVIGLRG
ncbi:MAG: DUF4147 domain-containing protein [Candidatus Thiodiazotropha sp.]|jgi:glycerate 2-kinase